MTVVRTFPGVGDGLWLDLVRTSPGQYDVKVAETGQVIAGGFVLPAYAEEWVVDLQVRQRQILASMMPPEPVT